MCRLLGLSAPKNPAFSAGPYRLLPSTYYTTSYFVRRYFTTDICLCYTTSIAIAIRKRPARSFSRPHGTTQNMATRRGALLRTGGYLMSFTSRLISRLMHLPPAQSHDIAITRDIQIPMPDGVVLFADHYTPRGGSKHPLSLSVLLMAGEAFLAL